MILVFVLCAIIIFISLLICMVIVSTLRIKIENLKISNMNKENSEQYRITISLHLWNAIKWISIKLGSQKIKKIYQKMQLEKFDFKKVQKDFKWEDIKELKRLNPEISYLNLEIKAGTEDVILTSFLVFAISTLLSMILPYTIKKYEKDKYNYKIDPIYGNQNVYKIKFNCIIQVKMVHIINIIYILLKKRRVDKNEQRASNRRAYAYSHEQY